MAQAIRLSGVPGSSPPESLIGAAVNGPAAPMIQRFVGPVGWWRIRLESLTLGSFLSARLAEVTVRAGFLIGIVILFFTLLIQRRIELKKGLVLAAFSIALSLPGPFMGLDHLGSGSLIRAAGCWAKGYSCSSSGRPPSRGYARRCRASALPSTHSARDASGRRRKGIAGRMVDRACVAGLWLMAMSFGTMVAGVATTEGSIRLPLFASPPRRSTTARSGPVWFMLIICAALRFPLVRRIRAAQPSSARWFWPRGFRCRPSASPSRRAFC